jgi:hypothetical protein
MPPPFPPPRSLPDLNSIRAQNPALYDSIWGNVAWQWMNDDYSSVYNAVLYFLVGGGDPLASLQSGQGPENIRNDYQRGHDTFQDNSTHPAAPFWYIVFSAGGIPFHVTPQNLPETMFEWYQRYGNGVFGVARDNWRNYQNGGELYDALEAGFVLVHALHDVIQNTPNVLHPKEYLAEFRYAFTQLTSIYMTQVWVHVGQ